MLKFPYDFGPFRKRRQANAGLLVYFGICSDSQILNTQMNDYMAGFIYTAAAWHAKPGGDVQLEALLFNICRESRKGGCFPGMGASGGGWPSGGRLILKPDSLETQRNFLRRGALLRAVCWKHYSSVLKRGPAVPSPVLQPPREPLGQADICHSHNLHRDVPCDRYTTPRALLGYF